MIFACSVSPWLHHLSRGEAEGFLLGEKRLRRAGDTQQALALEAEEVDQSIKLAVESGKFSWVLI